MGIAPSHFEEHQQREEEEQSAKALMMMNAHHARSISFGEEIPSDLECTICAEVRVYSFVSEITFLLGVTCFSRARARCFESAEGKKKREWERVSEERLLVAIPVTMWDRRDDASNESTSFSLFCFFSLSFLSLGESERLSVDLNAFFFLPFSLSLHLSLIYVYIK